VNLEDDEWNVEDETSQDEARGVQEGELRFLYDGRHDQVDGAQYEHYRHQDKHLKHAATRVTGTW